MRTTVMRTRLAGLVFTLLIAVSSHAGYSAFFQPSYIQVHPGEIAVVHVFAGWTSGISYYPFPGMTFDTDDATVATIEGDLPTTQEKLVLIHANQRGHALVRETGREWPWAFVSVADAELPVSIGVNGVLARGETITLTAITDDPDATYTWYWGKLGVPWSKAGEGKTLTFVPEFTANFEVWVYAESPRAAGAAETTVIVHRPRHRGVRSS